MYNFLSLFLLFSQLSFLVIVQVVLSFFLLLFSILKCSFSLSSRLSHITFFTFFHMFLTVLFDYHQGYHGLLFFFCYPFLLNILFFSFLRLPRMNFFLLLSFSLKLQFVNFDFLFIGDLTLFELVFPWSTANFAFCFSSS